MRMLACATLAVLAGLGPGWAEEIHRWTDPSGHVHYSNTPSGRSADEVPPPKPRTREHGNDAEATPGTRGDTGAAAAAASADAEATFSTQASLRRSTLERELRDTQKRIKSIDARLDELEHVRARNAQGSVSTGGVKASLDVRSEEEQRLVDEREELAKHVTDVRSDYTKLRQEVTSRLGTTPAWWIDAP